MTFLYMFESHDGQVQVEFIAVHLLLGDDAQERLLIQLKQHNLPLTAVLFVIVSGLLGTPSLGPIHATPIQIEHDLILTKETALIVL